MCWIQIWSMLLCYLRMFFLFLFFFFPFIVQSLVFYKNYVSTKKYLYILSVWQMASNKYFNFLFSSDFSSFVSVQINHLWWSLIILNTERDHKQAYVVSTFLIPIHSFFCFCSMAISANPIQLLRKGFASILRSQW